MLPWKNSERITISLIKVNSLCPLTELSTLDFTGSSHHYEVIDDEEGQTGKTEGSETETWGINPETGETNNAESKTSSGAEEELKTNINKETQDVVANSSPGILENWTGDNETLLDLSDIFENIQHKEEGEMEDLEE